MRGSGVLLGAGCAAVLGFWAYRIGTTWGSGYAVPGVLFGAAVTVLALLRRSKPLALAIAGLSVAAAAVVLARLVAIPSEPGPGLALPLAVLTGSAMATLPVRTSAALAAAHGAVAFGSLLAAHVPGIPPVTVLNVAAWLAALAYAGAVRVQAYRRRAMIARIRRDERARLARELHDVVGHHLTHMVLHAQATQLLARRTAAPPASGGEALAEIEGAGGEALAALRRVVALLRETDLPVRDPR